MWIRTRISKLICLALALFVAAGLGFGMPAAKDFEDSSPAFSANFEYSVSDEMANRDKIGSILIPVRLGHVDRVFYMQLDTGSSYSMFYEKRLATVNSRQKVYDGAIIDKKSFGENIALQIGGVNMTKTRFRLRDGGYDEKIDWESPSAINVIGTIGLDLLSNGIMEVDFLEKKFSLHKEMPSKYFGQTDNELSIVRGMMLFHFNLDGRPTKAVYDSGSSDYGLLTTRSNFEKLRTKNAPIVQTREKSFENFLRVDTSSTSAVLGFNGRNLPLNRVSTVEGISFAQRMAMSLGGVSGILGNRPFAQNILIIDLQKSRYGIVSPSR